MGQSHDLFCIKRERSPRLHHRESALAKCYERDENEGGEEGKLSEKAVGVFLMLKLQFFKMGDKGGLKGALSQ
ncbi:MAG TPA: hypothetical protein DD648_08345 [Candidatus Omnitrophica bacterium]|nr:hypothetical protein [Candidatus Omnitrophota bacterium]